MFKIHHVAITVQGIEKSILFYKLLGFSEKLRWRSEDNNLQIVHLENDGFIIELFFYGNNKNSIEADNELESFLKVGGIKHFALKVNSLLDSKNFFIKNGVNQAMEIKNGRTGIDYFFLKDPDGNFIEIVKTKDVVNE